MSVMFIAAVAVVAIVVAGVIVAVVLGSRRKQRSVTPAAPPPPVGPPPMNDLESALSQVTDRAGRPIRDAIDAEAGHVDDLRVPDDTGPLLRRALDHVAPRDKAHSSPPTEPDTEPGDDT